MTTVLSIATCTTSLLHVSNTASFLRRTAHSNCHIFALWVQFGVKNLCFNSLKVCSWVYMTHCKQLWVNVGLKTPTRHLIYRRKALRWLCPATIQGCIFLDSTKSKLCWRNKSAGSGVVLQLSFYKCILVSFVLCLSKTILRTRKYISFSYDTLNRYGLRTLLLLIYDAKMQIIHSCSYIQHLCFIEL